MIPKQAEADFKQHAVQCYPDEAVGCVVDGNYVPLKNEADNPELEFRVSTYPQDATCVLHSHTQVRNADPQEADMRGQQSDARPWGIIWVEGKKTSPITWFGDQIPIAPYLGRRFINGQQDCWCLVRDLYRGALGVDGLPNLPRNDDWFKGSKEDAQDLLSVANIEAAGFERISLADIQPWDLLLGSIGARVTNHCSVYAGKSQVLHHVQNRLSCRALVTPWLPRVNYVLRYRGFEGRVLPSPAEVLNENSAVARRVSG